MRNDFCTGYLAHSAKGKEWQKHKYVAKVKLANGKYFYFYNLQQYQAYLKKRNDANREAINEKKAAASAKAGASTDATKKSMTSEERKAADLARVMGATGSSKSKKSGSSKSSSSSKDKKTSSKSGKSSSSKSKSTTAKEKTSSGSSKKSSEGKSSSSKKTSEEKTTTSKAASSTKSQTSQVEATVEKKTPSLSSYKYQYDLKDNDVNSYSGQEQNRITRNQIEEIIQDTVDKYPDDSSGYLLSGFTNDINYSFKWVKENGAIKILDPDTDQEVSMDNALLNMNSVSIFRTDDKKKKS